MTNSQGIEGVPVGAKVVRVGSPADGESFIDSYGKVRVANNLGCYSSMCYSILKPDNPYNRFLHEVEEDIKKAGRERAGGDDYRVPRKGEEYWFLDTTMLRSNNDWTEKKDGLVLILKPKNKKVLVCEFPIENDGTATIMGQKVLAENAVGANCRIETRLA